MRHRLADAAISNCVIKVSADKPAVLAEVFPVLRDEEFDAVPNDRQGRDNPGATRC